MLTRNARRGLPAAVLLAVTLALTACDPNDPSSASSAPPNGDASSSVAPPGESGSDDKADPGCATDRLRITTEQGDSAAGRTSFRLVFQNTGTDACTLRGYPGVSFVKGQGTQLGKAAARTAGSTVTVTLAGHGYAHADLQTVNGQGGYTDEQCALTTVPALRIYPPNRTEPADIPWNRKECVGPDVQNLWVGPVHPTR